jgi:hypothetical protein
MQGISYIAEQLSAFQEAPTPWNYYFSSSSTSSSSSSSNNKW